MVHVIYIYAIIAGVVLGHAAGDPFRGYPIWNSLLQAVFWLPVLVGLLTVPFAKKVILSDISLMTAVHLGFNIYRNTEHDKKQLFSGITERMYPRWSKHVLYGKYLISGFEKLKKMNNYNPPTN